MFDLVVVGGGPGGVFAGLTAKNSNKGAKVIVLEKGASILSKIKVSGGGRCNVTNATFDPKELSLNYPRGGKELISAFHHFQPKDMISWLEEKGVSLKIDKSNKVFPSSDDSQTIIDCFLREIKKSDLRVNLNQNIVDISKKDNIFELLLDDRDIVTKRLLLATGSSPEGLKYAAKLGHSFDPFIPSLFSFKIGGSDIIKLAGVSLDNVQASLKSSSYTVKGPFLITHEGFSGPSVINLSSFGAKFLYEKNYKALLEINWLNNFSKDQILQLLLKTKDQNPKKSLSRINPFSLPSKLWNYFLSFFGDSFSCAISHIPNNKFVLLSQKLASDEYQIISKSKNKGEFVSCGGINLKEIDFKDMQSKKCENLYFAGELLNIDGITGGYNLQNCWTTGFIAGQGI
jgi:predicted Rossmann fold flavoprotein